ncbi:hypothetical protein K7X08_008299 [Anisodus acutangulus]|uniref:Uncharacterized protein n=1 Tax=Anisodus acutangulus TaxID=402998 RepID=A0A9Q1MTE9_9SOLA|nr:hypothetical protein K7X08_008299 [Anisodus acutangulus]
MQPQRIWKPIQTRRLKISGKLLLLDWMSQLLRLSQCAGSRKVKGWLKTLNVLANVVSLPPPLTSSAVPPHSPTNLDINALQFRRQNDLILVVDDRDQVHREEVVVSLVCENSEFSGANEFRRSISLGAFSRQQLLVADIQSVSMNRSVSTGRFMFSGQNKGKDSVVLS